MRVLQGLVQYLLQHKVQGLRVRVVRDGVHMLWGLDIVLRPFARFNIQCTNVVQAVLKTFEDVSRMSD